jgi:hypothetical protein
MIGNISVWDRFHSIKPEELSDPVVAQPPNPVAAAQQKYSHVFLS